MHVLVVILTTLAALVINVSAASACSEEFLFGNGLDPDPDTNISFVTPETGTVLKDDFLQIFVIYSEDRVGALTPLDHIHYNVAPAGSGLAGNGDFTMPDLTGRVELYLPSPENNGVYEVCAYLARADHTHLSDTACTTFVLATSGISVFLPRNDGLYDTTEVPLEFETYGTDVHYLKYSVDGENETTLEKGETTLDLPPLSNGTHTLTIGGFNADDQQLGKLVTRQFSVESQLTRDNAVKAKRFLARAKRAFRSGSADSWLKKANRLLKKMSRGGSVSADTPALDESSISSAVKFSRKALKQRSKKLVQKAIKTLKAALE